MNVYKKITGLLTVCMLCFACSDEQESFPFAGTDNYLTAFQLTQNGVAYKAVLLSDSIYVDVPENVDLTGAVATYSCCEQATVFPEPSKLKAWNEPQLFIVTAHEKTERKYVYTVRRKKTPAVVHEGNLLLQTQEDVERLATSGVTVVRGNLIVGNETGKDSVFSLAPLTALREIAYHLVLNGTYAGKDLKGLDHVEKLGGLKIGKVDVGENPTTADYKQNVVRLSKIDLPALREIGGDFVSNYVNLDTLTMPMLKSVGGDFFCSSNKIAKVELPLLESVGGFFHLLSTTNNDLLQQIELPRLKRIGGMVKMNYFSGVSKLELPELESTGGLKFYYTSGVESIEMPLLKEVKGAINIKNANKLARLILPAVEGVETLYFSTNKVLETIDMRSLKQINGDFYISGSPILGSMEGLAALERIGGKLTLQGLSSLNSCFDRMKALKKVKQVVMEKLPLVEIDLTPFEIEGALSITSLDYLTKIKGLNSSIGGDLEYSNSPTTAGVATTIFELDGITELKGTLNIKDVRNVTALSFPHLEKAGGVIFAYLGTKCTSVSLPKLKEVGLISTNGNGFSSVLSLSMPELTRVTGDLELLAKAIETLDFTKLTTIGGTLNMELSNYYNNTRLENLNGFKALTSVGKVTIEYFNGLKDYSGLKNVIGTLDASKWSVKNCAAYSPSWEDMKAGRYTKTL